MPRLKPGEHTPYPTLNDVNVGYAPFEVLSAGTEGRLGPGLRFKVVRKLKAGKRIALQSVCNPQVDHADGSTSWRYGNRPELKPAVTDADGIQWRIGYSKTGGRTMWFRMDHIRPADWSCIGPKWLDYRIAFGWPRRKRIVHYVIGKAMHNRRAAVRLQDTYIREGRMSTGLGYLLKGDTFIVAWSMRGYYYGMYPGGGSDAVPPGTMGVVIGLALKFA